CSPSRQWRRSAGSTGHTNRRTPPKPWLRIPWRSPLTEIPSASPSKTRTTAALAVVAVFIGGLLVGIAGDRFYLFHRHRLFPPRGMAQFATRRIVDHLDRELHFSPEQRIAVQKIIDQHHARIDS